MNMHTHRLDDDDIEKSKFREDLIKIKDNAVGTKKAIFQAVGDVKDIAQHTWQKSVNNVKDRSLQAQGNMVSYVQQNPVKTIGLALLTGALSAKLLKLI